MNTPIPTRARAAIREAPESWSKWLAVCDAIQADDIEMTVEEFAPFSGLFNVLVARGVPFDDAFVFRVRELQKSLTNTELDPFFDGHDDALTERELACDEHGERDDHHLTEEEEMVDEHWEGDAWAADPPGPRLGEGFNLRYLPHRHYTRPKDIAAEYTRVGAPLATADTIGPSDHGFPRFDAKAVRAKYDAEDLKRRSIEYCRRFAAGLE